MQVVVKRPYFGVREMGDVVIKMKIKWETKEFIIKVKLGLKLYLTMETEKNNWKKFSSN